LVWDAAQQAERFLITQDLDFSDVRRFQPGTHHGLMLVRLQTPSRRRLAERIESVFRIENVIDWDRCFVVVTDHKVRVRRP
jgi:predicted nuclease of predicted toxin-antitoxin system